MHFQTYEHFPIDGAQARSGGGATSESYRFWNSPRSSSSRAASEDVVVTSYHRSWVRGQWTPWNIAQSSTDLPEAGVRVFCGRDLNRFTTFEYNGEERLDGILTRKFTGIMDSDGDPEQIGPFDAQWEWWIGPDGRQVKNKFTDLHTGTTVVTVPSGWDEPNTVARPVAATPVSKPTPVTPEPTLEATETPAPTETPIPTATPIPTETPVPTTPPDPTDPPPAPTDAPEPSGAWLEPDPETVTFDGQWRPFTIPGTGLDEVRLSTNVRNSQEGSSSTGAVELSSRRSLPTPTDACQRTYSTGYAKNIGSAFHLVGCRAGTVIIRLADPNNDYAVLREYAITVSGGP